MKCWYTQIKEAAINAGLDHTKVRTVTPIGSEPYAIIDKKWKVTLTVIEDIASTYREDIKNPPRTINQFVKCVRSVLKTL